MNKLEKIEFTTDPEINKAHAEFIREIEEEERARNDAVEGIGRGYHLSSIGGLYAIANSKNKIVSKGYHDFSKFEYGGNVGIIGSLGADNRVLRIPDKENDFFIESPISFHSLRFDDDLGLLISQTGGMSYIVNAETGEAASKGYHDFFMKNGELFGVTGAREERVYYKPKQIEENNTQLESNIKQIEE